MTWGLGEAPLWLALARFATDMLLLPATLTRDIVKGI